jgi:hypothetical protein
MTEREKIYLNLMASKMHEFFGRLDGKGNNVAGLSYPIDSYKIFNTQMVELTSSIRDYFNWVISSGRFPDFLLLDEYKKIIAPLIHLYATFRDFSFLSDDEFPVQLLKRFDDHFGKQIKIEKVISVFPYYVPVARTNPAYSSTPVRGDIIPLVKNVVKDPKKLDKFPRLYEIGIPNINFACYPSLMTLYHEYGHIIVDRIGSANNRLIKKELRKDEIPESIIKVLKIGEKKFKLIKEELNDLFIERIKKSRNVSLTNGEIFSSLFNTWTDEVLSDILAYELIGPSLYFSYYCDCIHQDGNVWDVNLANDVESAHPSLSFRLSMLRGLFYKPKNWEENFADLERTNPLWKKCIIELPDIISPDRRDLKGNVVVDPKSFGSNDDLSRLLSEKLPDIDFALYSFAEAAFDHVHSFLKSWRGDVFTDINYSKVCGLLRDLINFLDSKNRNTNLRSNPEKDLQSLMLATCLGYFCILNEGPDQKKSDNGTKTLTLDDKLKLLNSWTQSRL